MLSLQIRSSRSAFSSRCPPTLARNRKKAADRRIFQIVVPQHIAPAGHLQTAVPRGKLAFCIRNRKICPHILDLCSLEPCFCDHLHRHTVGGIKDQHTAGGKRLPSPAPVPGPAGSGSNRTPRRQRTPPRRRYRSCQTIRGLSGRRGCFAPAPPAGSSCCRKAITSGKSRL